MGLGTLFAVTATHASRQTICLRFDCGVVLGSRRTGSPAHGRTSPLKSSARSHPARADAILGYVTSTVANGAEFGTDYLTRTAVAKSNILVNAPIQAKYFYQDLDKDGGRLNGSEALYRDIREGSDATRPWLLVADALQPVPTSSWPTRSIAISVGTKNKDLTLNPRTGR